MALEAFRLPAGAEVIVPDYTMIACARAVTLAGLTPVFVDCKENLLADDLLMNAAVSSDTGAIMLVHVYGRQHKHLEVLAACNISLEVGRGSKIMVVEDLAEAHGVRPHPETHAACHSFYRNKIVAGEEGGAVWFRDPDHARLARQLRCLGFTDAHDFAHVPRGHNYRLANCLAERVLDSLSRVEENVARRRWVEAFLDAVCPQGFRMPRRDAPWVYDLRLRGSSAAKLNEVVAALRAKGIEARHGFKPMSGQAEYARCRRVVGPDGSMAERLAQEVLYLPLTGAAPTWAFDVIHDVWGNETGGRPASA